MRSSPPPQHYMFSRNNFRVKYNDPRFYMFELPLFPLNTVLFPGMPLRLLVFEDRYRQLVHDSLSTNQTFGVSLIKSGVEALGPLPEPYTVGCTARIVQVDRQTDGKINLTVVGDERFRILRMGAGQPYLTAFAESVPLKSTLTLDVVRRVHALRDQLVQYLALLSGVKTEDQDGNGALLNLNLKELQLPEDPMMLIYLSAALLQIPPVEKQPLLEADTAALLLDRVQRLCRRELCVLPRTLKTGEDDAQDSAWMN